MTLQHVILSGGSGTRLWPLSRAHYPKQLIPLLGDRSLLQDTVARLDGLDVPKAPPLVVCNEHHRFMVAEQLRLLGREDGRILLEPVGRNTAPALTLAALAAVAEGGDPVLLATPADHVVRDAAAFRAAVAQGLPEAEGGAVVTFGIVPDRPETGYGYIRQGAAQGPGYRLAGFTEKPDRATAEAYLAGGDHLWNSGMFLLRASVWLRQLERFQPQMLEACRRAWEGGRADGDFCRIDAEAFAACPEDSIDYAVMEPLAREGDVPALVIPLDAGWSDVGSWDALWAVGEQDAAGNVTRGDVLSHDSRGNLVFAEHRLVGTVGVEDLIVVETADAVLVARKDRVQEVKALVDRLKAAGRNEVLHHRKVYRPWGSYESIDAGERFQVKHIIVQPGASLSLQMHHHRAEHWIVVRGTARVTRGDETFLLSENQSTYIPLGEVHRLENPGTIPLELIEVQSGSYLGEDDIVRFEDHYGR